MWKKFIERSMANGAKYGVREGIKRNLDPSEPSPKFNNDDAFGDNAVMVVITLSSVIIALYITAIVDFDKYKVFSEADLAVLARQPPASSLSQMPGTALFPRWIRTRDRHSI